MIILEYIPDCDRAASLLLIDGSAERNSSSARMRAWALVSPLRLLRFMGPDAIAPRLSLRRQSGCSAAQSVVGDYAVDPGDAARVEEQPGESIMSLTVIATGAASRVSLYAEQAFLRIAA